MQKSLKTLALLGSGMIILSCTLVVINQTAGVVQLAREVHPVFGTVTLWGLLIVYGGVIGVPVVMIMRMPKPLSPPECDSGPEFDEHLRRLSCAWRVTRECGSSSSIRPVRSIAGSSRERSRFWRLMPTRSSSKWRRPCS